MSSRHERLFPCSLFASKMRLTRQVQIGQSIRVLAEIPIIEVGVELECESGFCLAASRHVIFPST